MGYSYLRKEEIYYIKKALDYYNGINGCAQDFVKCYEYCNNLGEDNTFVKAILGTMFFNGNGVKKDRIKGIRLMIGSDVPKAKELVPIAFKKCIKENTLLPPDLLIEAIKVLGDDLEYNIENCRIIINCVENKKQKEKIKETEKTKETKETQHTEEEYPVKSKGIKHLIKMFESN